MKSKKTSSIKKKPKKPQLLINTDTPTPSKQHPSQNEKTIQTKNKVIPNKKKQEPQ